MPRWQDLDDITDRYPAKDLEAFQADRVFVNDLYLVYYKRYEAIGGEGPDLIHLSIKRHDKSHIAHDRFKEQFVCKWEHAWKVTAGEIHDWIYKLLETDRVVRDRVKDMMAVREADTNAGYESPEIPTMIRIVMRHLEKPK